MLGYLDIGKGIVVGGRMLRRKEGESQCYGAKKKKTCPSDQSRTGDQPVLRKEGIPLQPIFSTTAPGLGLAHSRFRLDQNILW